MKLETQKRKWEKGFVGLYLTIIVLVLMLGIIISIGFGVVIQQKIIQNITQSAQSYFAAESGVEDALIRLVNGQNVCDPPGTLPCSNSFAVAGATVDVVITEDMVTGVRTITAKGDSFNRFRTTQIVYEISSTTPGFFYGAQVGDGGIQLNNNAIVKAKAGEFAEAALMLREAAVQLPNNLQIVSNAALSLLVDVFMNGMDAGKINDAQMFQHAVIKQNNQHPKLPEIAAFMAKVQAKYKLESAP
jgi:hypothetical protein